MEFHDVIVTVAQHQHQHQHQHQQQPLVLLLQNELVIGRESAELVVADSEVSREHLRLRRRGQAVEVTDLNSTNGTFREGVKIDGPELIDSRTRYSIGSTEITVDFGLQQTGRALAGHSTQRRLSDDLGSTSISRVADSMSANQAGRNLQRSGDTITMVLSDIEASTARAAEIGDTAWFALLTEHNTLFRSVLRQWGGTEIKSVGDGFMMTFPSVRRALDFSCDVQRRVSSDDGPDVTVRIGLHTGEAIPDVTGDLFGRHVNLAVRVADLAKGGQILASLVVHEIAQGQDEVRFSTPIQAELKGFAQMQTVYEVLWR